MSKHPVEEFLDCGGVIHDGGAVVMSRETYARSIGYTSDGKPESITARFAQSIWWRKRDNSWIAIADMSPGHRYNTAAMLMQAAPLHAVRHAMAFACDVGAHDGGEMAHDALEGISDELNEQAFSDPRAWLRGTTLYRALTAGLKVRGAGAAPWQKTGRDPVTGKKTKVPPVMVRVCELPACGCSGEAHA